MTLKNKELEELHSELHALLSERQGELARCGSGENEEDKASCERLSEELATWKGKASDVPAVPEDEAAQKQLEEQASNLRSQISALGRD